MITSHYKSSNSIDHKIKHEELKQDSLKQEELLKEEEAAFQVLMENNLLQFEVLVNNIINNIDLEISLDQMYELVSSSNFNSDKIIYQTNFIEALISIMNPTEQNNLVLKCLMVLTYIWKINSFQPLLLNQDLIKIVIFYCENPNFDVSRFALSSLSNLSNYFPQLVSQMVPQQFYQFLNNNIGKDVLYGMTLPALKLLLSFCRIDMIPPIFINFVPNLISSFLHKSSNVMLISSEILYKIVFKYEDAFRISLENGLIDQMTLLVRFGDITRLNFIFELIIICITNNVGDIFFSDNFSLFLRKNIIQFYSEKSNSFYRIIQLLIPQLWKKFYEIELIDTIIQNAPNVQFHNKKYVVSCYVAFLNAADEETCINSVQKGGFSFLCEMVSVVHDANVLDSLLRMIYSILMKNGTGFIQIALDKNLIEQVQAIESEDENCINLISLIINYLQKQLDDGQLDNS